MTVNGVKTLHRFTHAAADDMEDILKDSNGASKGISEACDKIYEACDVCVPSGRPAHRKKISASHVNESCNNSFQADFAATRNINVRD